MNPRVDTLISKAKYRPEEMKRLRKIVLDCGLTEEMKWGKPCYTFEGKNILVIQGFKEYCALLFFKGYGMSDPDGILVKTGENTRVGRQIRFTDPKEIPKMTTTLKAYIYQAIEVEKVGVKKDIKKEAQPVPEEFQHKLNKTPALKKAFNALTPGRQRGYLMYFSAAKQSQTRESRIEKCMPLILKGKGINEQ